jgi:hypothetical protein
MSLQLKEKKIQLRNLKQAFAVSHHTKQTAVIVNLPNVCEVLILNKIMQ